MSHRRRFGIQALTWKYVLLRLLDGGRGGPAGLARPAGTREGGQVIAYGNGGKTRALRLHMAVWKDLLLFY